MNDLKEIDCQHGGCGEKIWVLRPEGYSRWDYQKPNEPTKYKEEPYSCKFGHRTTVYWTAPELPILWRNQPEN